VPQVHILLFIWGSGYFKEAGSLDAQFRATFSLSVVSASWGIAKFLKLGPCRLVPGDGLLGGYCRPSFLLLVVNNAVWLVGKGIFMAFGFTNWIDKDFKYDRRLQTCTKCMQMDFNHTAVLWVATFLLPQLALVSINRSKVVHTCSVERGWSGVNYQTPYN
jgi:hypothetical protein